MREDERVPYYASDVAAEILDTFLAFVGVRETSTAEEIATALNLLYGLALTKEQVSSTLDSPPDVLALAETLEPMRIWPLWLRTEPGGRHRNLRASLERERNYLL